MAKQTFDRAGFFAVLDAERMTRDLSWRQVAKETGMSASTFTRLRDGHGPDLDSLGVLCNWIGLDPGAFYPTVNRLGKFSLGWFVAELAGDNTLSPTARTAIRKVVVGVYEALKELP